MKIAVYSICKNEEAFVERFLLSCIGADLVVVADTGSTDNTVKEFTRVCPPDHSPPVALHHVSINPWRFDTARNVALALVPADIDVCIRLDIDEVLDPGWRTALEENWIEGTTQLWYWFNHAPGYRFRTNNIHARHGYRWRGLDHECLEDATGRGRSRIADDRLSITHHQDHTKDRTGILPRLVAQVKEDKRARTLYYLGREYYYYRFDTDAIATLKEYLSQPDATWPQERMDVMSMIAESYERLGNVEQAFHWHYRAIAEFPTREPMLGLSHFALKTGKHALAYGVAKQALTITDRMDSMFNKPAAWDGSLESIAQQAEPYVK
jgi:glycosyltransferase involved in cell wall biosynthesis